MGILYKSIPWLKMVYLAGTGLGPAAAISKNGGSFATPSGGAGMTEVGSGWYSIALLAADTDTLGDLAYSFSNGTMSAEFVDQVRDLPADPWAVALPGAYIAGEAGFMLGNAVLSDPWAKPLPGAYPAGQAGYLLGNVGGGSDPWAVPLPGAYPAGQAGYLLGHIGGGSDPWATLLPGAYTAGQAGNIVGTNLDASIKALIYFIARGGRLPPG